MLFANVGSIRPAILVFGGGSALGIEVVSRFVSANWKVVTLDFYDSSVECGGVDDKICGAGEEGKPSVSLTLPPGAPPRIQLQTARGCLKARGFGDKRGFDVIVNATLGWVGGGLSDDGLFDSLEYMYKTSVESSLITAMLSREFLSKSGMMALIGSVAALSPQPKMLGFSLSKAAVHQLVRCLAEEVGNDLPEDVKVLGLVPEVLDTPMHRSMNKNGKAEKNWTPCDVVAKKLEQWATDKTKRPPNASLIAVYSEPGDHNANANETKHHFRLISNPSFVQRVPL